MPRHRVNYSGSPADLTSKLYVASQLSQSILEGERSAARLRKWSDFPESRTRRGSSDSLVEVIDKLFV